MSRYIVEALKDHQEVVVGWDDPLQTYFVTVFDTYNLDEEVVLFSRGDRPKDIENVFKLERVMVDWGKIPSDVLLKLAEDKENAVSPTPFQEKMIEMVNQLVE